MFDCIQVGQKMSNLKPREAKKEKKKPRQKPKRPRFTKSFFAESEAEEVQYANIVQEEEEAEEIEEIPRDTDVDSNSPWTLSESENDDSMVFRRRLSD